MSSKILTPVEALKIAQELFPWVDRIEQSMTNSWIVFLNTDKFSRYRVLDCEIDFDGPWQESLHDENGRVL